MFSLIDYINDTTDVGDKYGNDTIPTTVVQPEIIDVKDNIPYNQKLLYLMEEGTSSQKEWAIKRVFELSLEEIFTNFIKKIINQFESEDPRIELILIDCLIDLNDLYSKKFAEVILDPILTKFENNNFAAEYLGLFKKMFSFFSAKQIEKIFVCVDNSLSKMSNQQLSAISLLCVTPFSIFKDNKVNDYFHKICKINENSTILQTQSVFFAFTFADHLSDDDLFDFFKQILMDSEKSDECAILFLKFSDIALGPRFPQIKFYFLPLISKLATSSQVKIRTDLPELIAESPLVIEQCEIPLKNAVSFLARDLQAHVRSSCTRSLPAIYSHSSQKLQNHIIDVYLFLFDDQNHEVRIELMKTPQIKMLLHHDITKITFLFKFIKTNMKKWRMVSQFIQSLCSISFEMLHPYINDIIFIVKNSIVENPNALANSVTVFYSSYLHYSLDKDAVLNDILDFYMKSENFWMRRNFIILSTNLLTSTVYSEKVGKYLVPNLIEMAKEKIKTIQYAYLKLAVVKIVDFLDENKNPLVPEILDKLSESLIEFENSNDEIIEEYLKSAKELISKFRRTLDAYLGNNYNIKNMNKMKKNQNNLNSTDNNGNHITGRKQQQRNLSEIDIPHVRTSNSAFAIETFDKSNNDNQIGTIKMELGSMAFMKSNSAIKKVNNVVAVRDLSKSPISQPPITASGRSSMMPKSSSSSSATTMTMTPSSLKAVARSSQKGLITVPRVGRGGKASMNLKRSSIA